jgi:pimeloyl-ACP methyl ester carboxylesterase
LRAGFTASHRGGSGPPLVCLHGFTDTWRTWEPVLDALESRHDVLAPTLAGHAGGPPLNGGGATGAALADAVERAMDDAGFATAHLVGNTTSTWRPSCWPTSSSAPRPARP